MITSDANNNVNSQNSTADGAESDCETSASVSLPPSPRSSAVSPPNTNFAHEHDHDYENVASPCSSTNSGPIYVRPPGFTHHAQEVECPRSKIVRKKSRPATMISMREGLKKREQTPPKSKPRRGKFKLILSLQSGRLLLLQI